MIDTADTSDTGPRNTRVRMWTFTKQGWEGDIIGKLISYFSGTGDTEYLFGKELGKTGYEHLQGTFRFKNARSKKAVFNEIKSIFPDIHLEVCRNWFASIEYCQKEGIEVFTNIEKHRPKRIIQDPLEDKELHDFQIEIINMMKEEPDDRKIYWYYEKQGNVGKTTLAKSLCIRYPGNVMVVGGRANDIKYGISKFIENEKNDLKMVIFDFVRSSEEYVSYEAIEAIKNGIFFNSKYESGMVVFNSCHVVIFANFEPDMLKLSMDRWVVQPINSVHGKVAHVGAPCPT